MTAHPQKHFESGTNGNRDDQDNTKAYARNQGTDPGDSQRQLPGQRWINIALRSAHLVGVTGIGGGFLLDVDDSFWMGYWWLAISTGVLLSLLYLWINPLWAIQLKGMAIIGKLVLLGIGVAVPDWRATMFVLVVLVSAFIAHAPGSVRGYRIGMGKSVRDEGT